VTGIAMLTFAVSSPMEKKKEKREAKQRKLFLSCLNISQVFGAFFFVLNEGERCDQHCTVCAVVPVARWRCAK
jgi:hypothetical protein